MVPHEPVLDAIPLDDATREELGRFTPDELTQLENLARDTSPEDFRRLAMRVSLSPGTVPEAALLERVPGLLSRDHVLQAVQEVRGHEPHTDLVPEPDTMPPAVTPGPRTRSVHRPTHASVTPLARALRPARRRRDHRPHHPGRHHRLPPRRHPHRPGHLDGRIEP